MGKRIFATFCIVLALLGLYLASQARDDGMFVGGMLFTLFGVLVNFWLIAQDDRDELANPSL